MHFLIFEKNVGAMMHYIVMYVFKTQVRKYEIFNIMLVFKEKYLIKRKKKKKVQVVL